MAHSDETKQAFLDALAKSGIVADALRVAGVATYAAIKRWRTEDEEFAAGYDEAIEFSADTLESEARRRAVEGVTRMRALGSGDNMTIVEEVTYSDTLMLALLKANKPDKFADRSKSEITSPDGSLKPESDVTAAARIAAMLDEARRRRDADADDVFK